MTTSNKHFFETKEQYLAFRQAWRDAINKHGAKPTAAHYMFYNIIRGKNAEHGFTPFQRLSKMEGMGTMNRGAVMAAEELSRLNNAWNVKEKETFLAVFGGTFTVKDYDRFVAEGFLPDVPVICPSFGKGRQIFKRLQDEDLKIKTCEELTALYRADEKEAA